MKLSQQEKHQMQIMNLTNNIKVSLVEQHLSIHSTAGEFTALVEFPNFLPDYTFEVAANISNPQEPQRKNLSITWGKQLNEQLIAKQPEWEEFINDQITSLVIAQAPKSWEKYIGIRLQTYKDQWMAKPFVARWDELVTIAEAYNSTTDEKVVLSLSDMPTTFDAFRYGQEPSITVAYKGYNVCVRHNADRYNRNALAFYLDCELTEYRRRNYKNFKNLLKTIVTLVNESIEAKERRNKVKKAHEDLVPKRVQFLTENFDVPFTHKTVSYRTYGSQYREKYAYFLQVNGQSLEIKFYNDYKEELHLQISSLAGISVKSLKMAQRLINVLLITN